MSSKKRNDENEKMDDSWLLPYSDMLTLLLALFIVLFAMSEIDIKKFERLANIFQTEFSSGAALLDEGLGIVPNESDEVFLDDEIEDNETDESDKDSETDRQGLLELEKLQAMQEDIDEYIAANNMTDTLGTKLTGEGLLITISTDVTFDSGSAQVKAHGIEIAKEIANVLSTDPPHEIVINGHADDRPMNNEQFASNWELSAMRAIQFMYILLDESEIDPKFFSARGYGEFQPIVPNTSEENRAKNRRVEVLIQPNYNIEEMFE